MHVVVTGASSGIGEAIARAFAQRGASLTLVARRLELLEAIAADLDTPCHLVTHDLSEPEHATTWLSGAIEALGEVDVLVNNAGMQIIGPAEDQGADAGERLLRLNLLTPLRLTAAVLPKMRSRSQGCIVDMASMAALAPTPGMLYYNASKGGLAAASEALRAEVKPDGLHVVTVYPGIIPTDMGDKGLAAYDTSWLLKMQPRGRPERLAELICEAVQHKRDRVIYPPTNALARSFPSATRWFMDRFTPGLKSND